MKPAGKWVLAVVVAGVLGLAGSAQRPQRVDLEAAQVAIMDADTRFCEATRGRGLEGF